MGPETPAQPDTPHLGGDLSRTQAWPETPVTRGRILRPPGYSGLPETPGILRWYSGGVSSTAPHLGQMTGKTKGPDTPACRPETDRKSVV